ncbi:hypothetical protein GCM10023206_06650 [Acinetobacter puyangensis]|uniref:Uncharacterized protein n=1 Tax=Acinetobacter puyangensis TaxID=1096779 RepID=A0A240E6Q4_9GAMM|nr:hypothetical protein [Acinetobacter puyangensis]SNX44256.1 hypothetical protein SAMN05421731_102417 [Acinetobacter puyangensis]
METAFKLSKDSGMQLNHALDSPISFASIFYDSDAYKIVKQERKYEAEKQQTLYKIANEIIKALNNINSSS